MKAKGYIVSPQRLIRKYIFILALTFIVFMHGGCASPIAVTEFQDRLIPVKCGAVLPPRPKFDRANPQSAAELGAYYETLYEACVENDGAGAD